MRVKKIAKVRYERKRRKEENKGKSHKSDCLNNNLLYEYKQTVEH